MKEAEKAKGKRRSPPLIQPPPPQLLYRLLMLQQLSRKPKSRRALWRHLQHHRFMIRWRCNEVHVADLVQHIRRHVNAIYADLLNPNESESNLVIHVKQAPNNRTEGQAQSCPASCTWPCSTQLCRVTWFSVTQFWPVS